MTGMAAQQKANHASTRQLRQSKALLCLPLHLYAQGLQRRPHGKDLLTVELVGLLLPRAPLPTLVLWCK